MYPAKKSKAIAVLSLITIFIGTLAMLGWAFKITLLQTIYPEYFSIKFYTPLCFIFLGTALFITQLENKKYNALFFLALSIFVLLTGISSVANYLHIFNTGVKIGFLISAAYFLLASLILILKIASWLKGIDMQQKNADALKERLEKQIKDGSFELDNLSEKLKKCDGNYQALIDQVYDAINVIDRDGNFIDVNSGMCRMTGYTREELLKLNVVDIIDPEQLKTDPVIMSNYSRDKSTVRERRLVRKTGEIFNVEINVTQFTDDRLLVILHDITRQKQLEAELREAKLKFHTLAERSAAGIYIVQKENFVYVNPRFAEIFGYQPYELVNLQVNFVNILIHQDYQAIVRRNLQKRYSGEVDFINYEVTGIKKDGTLNHVEFSGSRAIINGEPTIIGTMIDVTERWRMEEFLKQSEANFHTILNTTDTAYILLDKNLKVTAFNQMADKFVNTYYDHNLKIDDQLKDYFPAERLAQFLNLVDDVLKGNNISYQIDYPQPDGAIFWYYVRMFPIVNNTGEVFGSMLALSDITERKKAEESLQLAYAKIQTHINSIKNMVWKQSHLTRSPIANLKGLFALLQDDPLDNELLNHIKAELERLDKVIVDMADDASDHEL